MLLHRLRRHASVVRAPTRWKTSTPRAGVHGEQRTPRLTIAAVRAIRRSIHHGFVSGRGSMLTAPAPPFSLSSLAGTRPPVAVAVGFGTVARPCGAQQETCNSIGRYVLFIKRLDSFAIRSHWACQSLQSVMSNFDGNARMAPLAGPGAYNDPDSAST